MSRFVNLHQHTVESHLDAIVNIDLLFDRVKELGQTAVAITDHGSMGGIYKAYKAYKRTGVKLIPGNEIYFVTDLNAPRKDPITKKPNPAFKRYHLVLLAANHEGYKNLLRVTYEGYKNSIAINKKQVPRVDEAILRKYSDGLFALSACGGNIIAQSLLTKDHDKAIEYAKMLADIFKNRFYIELQPHEMRKKDGVSQLVLNKELKNIAEQLNIPMVATCDAHYLLRQDEKYHDMILAIADGKALQDQDRHRYTNQIKCEVCDGTGFVKKAKCVHCVKGIAGHELCDEFYVKTEEEVRSYFSRYFSDAFAEQLISTTEEISNKCLAPDYIAPHTKEHIPYFGEYHIKGCPDYEAFKKWQENKSFPEIDAAYLRFLCGKAFTLYTKDLSPEKRKIYFDRMKFEVETLESKKFCSYMLIVHDFLRWSKDNNILIGPGRGSVCGSLVAFFLGIHRIDPIEYDLVFERFINLEKKSLPDVDTDFSPQGREKVFKYVRDKYGEDKVAYISNINRITPKVAVKDVCRSLMIGGSKGEAFMLANFATSDIPSKATLPDGKIVEVNTMEKAIKHCTGNNFKELIRDYPDVLDYCKAIVGLPRGYSTHAAGVVISDIPLYDFAPMRRDGAGNYAVQYEKNQVEENNLVKMDFLGLETLDIISEIISQCKDVGIECPDLKTVENNPTNENAFKLIGVGYTAGCFQMDGGTCQPLCAPMAPKSVKEIAFINALARPSCTAEERQDFINRKHKRAKAIATHPILQDVLEHTYGVPLYEEDLMKLARKIAGWDFSKADQLRKLTKLKEKGADLALKVEKEFIDSAVAHSSISTEDANFIWNKTIVPFTRYAFNLSHAVAYSMLSYSTAFYKSNYKAAFFASVINSKLKHLAKKKDQAEEAAVTLLKREAKSKVFRLKFKPCDVNISSGYYKISSREEIVTGLNAVAGLGKKSIPKIFAGKPYSSIEDFIQKNLYLRVNEVKALSKAGAFDSLGVSRKYVHDNYETIKATYRNQIKKNQPCVFAIPVSQEEWSPVEKLSFEKEVLDEYISGSVLEMYPDFFNQKFNLSENEFDSKQVKAKIKAQGLITGVKVPRVKNGKDKGREFGIVSIDNGQGLNLSVFFWASEYELHKENIKPNVAIKGLFSVNKNKFGGKDLHFLDGEFKK